MTNIERVKEELEKTNSSLVVLKDDKIDTYYHDKIKDLVAILTKDVDALKDATIGDKIIGKVAAAIMIKAGVKEVYTKVMSRAAKEIFQAHEIQIVSDLEIPYIENRTKTGMCPMEEKFLNESNVDVIWEEYIK